MLPVPYRCDRLRAFRPECLFWAFHGVHPPCLCWISLRWELALVAVVGKDRLKLITPRYRETRFVGGPARHGSRWELSRITVRSPFGLIPGVVRWYPRWIVYGHPGFR